MRVSRSRPAILSILAVVLVMAAVPSAWAQAAATTTTLGVSSNAVPQGTAVTLTATVATSGATPVTAGLVVFCNASATHCEDTAIFGSAWMTKAGTATIYTTLGPGAHNIQAVFKGTNADATSTSTVSTVTVTASASAPAPTTTTLTATGTPGSYVLSATVTGTGTAAPTGSVSFLDASAGNVALAPPVALGAPTSTTSSFTNSPGPSTGVIRNQAIAVADFNKDGKLDYVIANQSPLTAPTATIMLGNGDGTFTLGNTYGAGSNPVAAVVADFNGDGNLDIAFANNSGNGVTVLLGNGDGTFTAGASPSVGYAASIAVGDFNGDGIPDLAVASANGDVVTILQGNGDGTFSTGASVAVPPWSGSTQGIVAMDFNGDGKTDLAVTSSDQSSSPQNFVVTILQGNGDGTFTTGASYTTGSTGQSIAEGDFNGDGIPDLAIANYGSSSVTVLLGVGDGTFTAVSPSPTTGFSPFAIVAGDFNNDGILDLATANFFASTVTILQGKGDGTFTPAPSPVPTGAEPDGIATGDFTGSGLTDLVTADYEDATGTILLQLGNGALKYSTTVSASGITVYGSGAQQVFASYSGDTNYLPSNSPPTTLTGTSLPPPTLSLPAGTYPEGTALTITATAGASIYYTTDGSVPTTSSTLYSGSPILLNSTPTVASETITAIAAVGTVTSTPVAVTYTLTFPQTISFPNPEAQFYGTPLTLSATASSGLPVSFALISGPATLSSGVLTFTGAGAVTVQATQAGNAVYVAATPVIVTFDVVVSSTALTPSALNFGSLPVAGTASTQTVTFAIPLGITLGSVTAKTEGATNLDYTIVAGGSCAPGSTTLCTVEVQFLATAVGPRPGALVFADNNHNTLASLPLFGIGTAPLVAFTPGTASTLPVGLSNPSFGAAMDGSGNLYIAQSAANTVLMATPGPGGTWTVTTIAGGGSSGLGDGGPAFAAQLNNPTTVSVDGAGNLYIADSGNNRIRLVTPSGIISTFAGGGTPASGNGDGGPATGATLSAPFGTASDASGNLYIGDAGDNLIRVVNAVTGVITTFAGGGTPASGNGDGGPATGATLNAPHASAFDAPGDLYIADSGNNLIRQVTPSGTISTFAGGGTPASGNGDNGLATAATLSSPQNAALDAAGDLYIADQGNNVIREVNAATGVITTAAGAGTPAGLGLTAPAGVALDAAGDLYIVGNFSNAFEVNVSAVPALSFGMVTTGNTSAETDVTVLNLGNAALAFSTIGTAADFPQTPDTTCTAASPLSPAGSCLLGIEFEPLTAGNFSESVVLTDNSLNVIGATQSISLTGTTLIVPVITWAPAPITYGTALSATQLDAAASVPGSFVYNPPAGTVLPAGAQTLSVTFTPTDAIDYATVTATVVLTVNPATSAVPAIVSISPAFVTAGGADFVLTVAGSGFVSTSTVYWGATALVTQFVSATQLTATVPAADTATAGTFAITVQTPAPGGTSNQFQFEVDSAAPANAPVFTTSVVTAPPGTTAAYPVTLPTTVTPVSITCLNLPSGATCSYSATTGAVTITTSATTPPGTYQVTVVFTETVTAAAVLLPFVLLPFVFARRRSAARSTWITACLGLVLIASAATFISCGGSGGSGGSGAAPTPHVTSSGVVRLNVK